jgi:hypothetical protein
MHGENRNAYRVLVGKAGGMKLHARLRCRWEDNIKIYLERNGMRDCGLD